MSKEVKEKLEIYVDEEGKRRDPNRSGHPVLCSARSKRSGELCKNIARANGKCRNHGGNSTGPKTAEGKARSLEAVRRANTKTGEHAAIWFDMLTPDEQELIYAIPNDAYVLLAQEIQLTTVRERRMLNHIRAIEQYIIDGRPDVYVQESWKRQLKRDAKGDEIPPEVRDDGSVEKASELVLSSKLVIKDDPRKQLQALEDALTRVQAHKHKLIELQHKINEGNVEEDTGALKQLNSILNGIREQRKVNNARIEMENKAQGEELSTQP